MSKQKKEIKIREAIQTDMIGDIPFTMLNYKMSEEDIIKALSDICLEVADNYEMPILHLLDVLKCVANTAKLSEKNGDYAMYHDNMWYDPEDLFFDDEDAISDELLRDDVLYDTTDNDDEDGENDEETLIDYDEDYVYDDCCEDTDEDDMYGIDEIMTFANIPDHLLKDLVVDVLCTLAKRQGDTPTNIAKDIISSKLVDKERAK